MNFNKAGSFMKRAISFIKSVTFIKCLKMSALFHLYGHEEMNFKMAKSTVLHVLYCMSVSQPVPVICQESFHDNTHQRYRFIPQFYEVKGLPLISVPVSKT